MRYSMLLFDPCEPVFGCARAHSGFDQAERASNPLIMRFPDGNSAIRFLAFDFQVVASSSEPAGVEIRIQIAVFRCFIQSFFACTSSGFRAFSIPQIPGRRNLQFCSICIFLQTPFAGLSLATICSHRFQFRDFCLAGFRISALLSESGFARRFTLCCPVFRVRRLVCQKFQAFFRS
ncbi:hypothetical protein L596_019457 [Steinernema carpocapsae]|uniref:Uncharacterized protein n=1 Tax=Steinernema carpocapsae TaxID=34508 RepID=A0A4U5MQR4_STECR|nr:hypothetical protein L596_019457 [Steinernema carpocapsae]